MGTRGWSRFVTVVVGLGLEVLAELVYAHVCVYADVHVHICLSVSVSMSMSMTMRATSACCRLPAASCNALTWHAHCCSGSDASFGSFGSLPPLPQLLSWLLQSRLDSARPVIGGDASVIDLPACCNFQQIRPRPPARPCASPRRRPTNCPWQLKFKSDMNFIRIR